MSRVLEPVGRVRGASGAWLLLCVNLAGKGAALALGLASPGVALDRKSTRLNSSH